MPLPVLRGDFRPRQVMKSFFLHIVSLEGGEEKDVFHLLALILKEVTEKWVFLVHSKHKHQGMPSLQLWGTGAIL